MPSTTPLDINTNYVANAPAAQQKIRASALDDDHNNIEQWANNDLLPALARVIRDDDSLVDGLVRVRNLSNEVVMLLASATGWQPKAAADGATTANITLTGEQIIDGVNRVNGKRIVVKDQTAKSENGIYLVGTPWTRDTDADTLNDLDHAYVFIKAGTTQAGVGFVTTTSGYTIGVSDIEWAQVTGQYQTPVAVAQGGTGGTTQATARAGIGSGIIGDALFTAITPAAARGLLGALTVGDAVFVATNPTVARAALGSNTMGDSLFTAATAANARALLGFDPAMNAVLLATSLANARLALGFPVILDALWTAASLTLGRQALGAGAAGEAVFQAAATADARTAAGIIDDLKASVTYDPGSLAANASEASFQTITVTGAVLGDFVRASFSLDMQGCSIVAWVSATDTVKFMFKNQNSAGGSINLGSGTVRIRVTPYGAP